jgi:hypothetical protein
MTTYESVIVGVSIVTAMATILGFGYKIRRDTQKDRKADKEETKALIAESENRVKTEVINHLESDKKLMKLEIEALNTRVSDTNTAIINHIKYSKANHPTNDTVFPFLKRIESEIKQMKDDQVQDLKDEIAELKKKDKI